MVRWGCELTTRNYPEPEQHMKTRRMRISNRPALVICNHQSHLDLPLLIAMHPKLVFLTNDWVWNSPVFGNIIHHADFLPVSEGIENIMPRLRKTERERLLDCDFSSRRNTFTRQPCDAFPSGCVPAGKRTDLDVLPLVLHGAGTFPA